MANSTRKKKIPTVAWGVVSHDASNRRGEIIAIYKTCEEAWQNCRLFQHVEALSKAQVAAWRAAQQVKAEETARLRAERDALVAAEAQ